MRTQRRFSVRGRACVAVLICRPAASFEWCCGPARPTCMFCVQCEPRVPCTWRHHGRCVRCSTNTYPVFLYIIYVCYGKHNATGDTTTTTSSAAHVRVTRASSQRPPRSPQARVHSMLAKQQHARHSASLTHTQDTARTIRRIEHAQNSGKDGRAGVAREEGVEVLVVLDLWHRCREATVSTSAHSRSCAHSG